MSAARILAVDDQLYFRVYLEDLLRDAQYELASAGSGPEALALLERESFDVVLTDLVMPGMDGSELVQRVKERWPSQEIVVITSVGDVKTAVDAMKLGATDYLLKPLDRTVLLRCLEAIAERHRTRDENRRLTAENLDYLSASLPTFPGISPEWRRPSSAFGGAGSPATVAGPRRPSTCFPFTLPKREAP